MFSIGIAWPIGMKRRWKVGMALAVVGLTGFFVWVFQSPPSTGVAIRFLGYETNRSASPRHWIPTNSSGIEARFCLTNGSRQAIAFYTFEDIPLFVVETKTDGQWSRPPRSPMGTNNSWRIPVLQSAQSICFTLPVPDLSQPLRLAFQYSTNGQPPVEGVWDGRVFVSKQSFLGLGGTTFFTRLTTRVSGWFRRTPAELSVSITIQDR